MADQHAPADRNTIREYIEENVDEDYLRLRHANACGIGTKDNAPCLTLYQTVDGGAIPRGTERVEAPIEYTDKTGKKFKIPVIAVPAGTPRFDKQSGNAANHLVPGGVGIEVQAGDQGQSATVATLGGWAWDQRDDCLVFVSNAHVLGIKDDRNVFYPVLVTNKQPFGRSSRGSLKEKGKNKADCAIGVPHDPKRAELKVQLLGPAIMTIAEAKVGDTVEKMGSGSNRTRGTIIDDAWTGSVSIVGGPSHLFGPVFRIDPSPAEVWSVLEDSGSLVFAENGVDGTRPVVALHFSGYDLDGRAYGVACPIQAVFEALDITTLPSGILASIVSAAAGTPAKSAAMLQVVSEFRARCETTPPGERILILLDSDAHRMDTVTAFATNADLRATAAEVFRALFGGFQHVDDALTHPLGHDVVEKIRQLGEALANQDAALRAAVKACLDHLPRNSPAETSLATILRMTPITAGL